jgi:hypothetical protein
VREYYFPGELDAPPQALSAIQSFAHVPYAVGEASYSHWPHVVTRRGTHKLFFEERAESHGEQYWSARSFEMLRQGRVRAAVLLASPVENRRTQEYAKLERVEFRRLDDAPLVAPPVVPAVQPRDWPAQPGTIFVAIASYRDSETPHTLRDLFASANIQSACTPACSRRSFPATTTIACPATCRTARPRAMCASCACTLAKASAPAGRAAAYSRS